MKHIITKLFVVLFVLMAAQSFAEEKNSKPALWKWTSGSSDSKNSSMFKSSSSGNLFKGPQLNLPKFQAIESAKATTGRMYDSAKRTTGQMWNSTVDFLNPWDGKSTSQSKPKSGAWFFQKKEEPQYNTVNDFLRQDRPRF